ncbi:MAG: tRNA lysidine(34) synthetase TilS [Saprospiraceae bacterium]|nr:tRNA lysidine(34) synthetase TilS [Saprospiraceae bacterium]
MSGIGQLNLDTFLKSAEAYHLWGPQDALLVGISGGPDSVALTHLAHRSGQLAGLAHVNYHLRGAESDQDEQLVRQLGEQFGVPVHVLHSSPDELAACMGLSLQMAARNVRYTWWNELIAAGQGSCLLTGHQADDQIETILLHWLRGTGLAGWSGIPCRRDVFCRPLLPFTRQEVMAYLENEGLVYRLDSSNETNTYLRNQLRHQIVPGLLKLKPALHSLVQQQSQDAAGALLAAEAAMDQLTDQVVRKEGNTWTFDLSKLQSVRWSSFAWYRWLHPKGFSRDQLQAIDRLTPHDHGQYFEGAGWECVVNRGQVICQPVRPGVSPAHHHIWPYDQVVDRPDGMLTLTSVDHYLSSEPGDLNRMIVDADQLVYPLTLREWRAGDRIQPKGMAGSKKIKDILIDAKADRFEKEKTLVLTHGPDQEIIWLLGYRLSAQVHPGPGTRSYLELQWLPKEQGA